MDKVTRVKVFLQTAVLSVVISSYATAAGAAGATAPAAPTKAELYLMSKGSQITQAFPSQSGLKAIVVDNGTQKRLFYVTPDGEGLVAGLVFDSTGANVTSADMSRAGVSDVGGAAAATPSQLDAIWQQAGQAAWIEEGKGGPLVYVFFDPNCPYCHRLWGNMRQAVQAGEVTVRWLPVAILAESSKGMAAAIYNAPAPSEKLGAMVNWQMQPETISKEVNLNLSRNLLLMRDTGQTGVPVIVYQKGGATRTVAGALDAHEISQLLR